MVSLAVSYDIEEYYINAEVLENGDVSVEEIFLVDGTMNGYELNLSTSSSNSTVSASAISNVSVAGANIDSISFDTFEENFTDFTLVSFANIGDSQKYTVDNTYNGVSIRMYYPINNEKIAFKVSYTLEDAIILHNGFAEFYWNFFSGELQDEINDLNVRVVFGRMDNYQEKFMIITLILIILL